MESEYCKVSLVLVIQVVVVVVSLLFHLNETRFSESYFNNRKIDYLHL